MRDGHARVRAEWYLKIGSPGRKADVQHETRCPANVGPRQPDLGPEHRRGQVLRTAVCREHRQVGRIQLQMLRRKGRADPFYWVSFIQAGEWASLDGQR
jgi:hypothetical protein